MIAEVTEKMATRVTIEPTHIALETGQRYRVHYEGRVLLENTRVPLLDACRALLAEGITGRLEMWRVGRSPRDAAVDIEVGAGWTVSETRDVGPLFARWRSFARDGEEDAFPADTGRCRTAGNELGPPLPTPPQLPALARTLS